MLREMRPPTQSHIVDQKQSFFKSWDLTSQAESSEVGVSSEDREKDPRHWAPRLPSHLLLHPLNTHPSTSHSGPGALP